MQTFSIEVFDGNSAIYGQVNARTFRSAINKCRKPSANTTKIVVNKGNGEWATVENGVVTETTSLEYLE